MADSPLASSNGPSPLVTIAIPSYNRAALLRTCVASALAQSYDNFEVLVCDNASTDDTRSVLEAFSDSRLRVVRHQTNIGLLPNWNACLTQARGEYIVVVSDDDVVKPWLLERCVSVAAHRSGLPIVIALSDLHLGATGEILAARASPHLQTGVHDGPEILLAYLRDEIGVIATCSVMCRTEAIRAAGGFPLTFRLTADIAAWAPLLFMGKAGLVNEACATWYSHGGSETARLSVEQALRDGWGIAELISELADCHMPEAELRARIRSHARRCFANRGLTMLAEHRRKGGSLAQVLSLLWRSRHCLRHATVTSALRFAAISFAPRAIDARARRLGRIFTGTRREKMSIGQAR